MSAVLIDTNIYCDAMRGDPPAVSVFQRFDQILMSPVVIGELMSGFKSGSREKSNLAQLRQFLAQDRVRVTAISAETSEFYAFILEELRKNGTPVPTNDIWIAASAMESGAHLATRDRHFAKIKGVLLTSY